MATSPHLLKTSRIFAKDDRELPKKLRSSPVCLVFWIRWGEIGGVHHQRGQQLEAQNRRMCIRQKRVAEEEWLMKEELVQLRAFFHNQEGEWGHQMP